MLCKNVFLPFAKQTVLVGSMGLLVLSCKEEVEETGFVDRSSTPVNSSLPNDPRLYDLLKNVAVIDYTAEPKYKKCTDYTYEIDESTRQFKATPESGASVSTYIYDEKGRKVFETYEYGSEFFRSKSGTKWTYDDLGRVSKTESGSVLSDDRYSPSRYCFRTYLGNTTLLTKNECFYSHLGGDDERTGTLTEISYDLFSKKKTVVEKSKSYGSTASFWYTSREIVEEHADTDFTFPMKKISKSYQFDSDTQSVKLSSESSTDLVFEDNKFQELLYSNYYIGSDGQRDSSKLTCSFADNELICSGDDFADEGNRRTGQAVFIPILYKYNSADLLMCTSPNTCLFSDEHAQVQFDLMGLMKSLTLSTSSEGANVVLQERVSDLSTSLRPWVVYEVPGYTDISRDADGFISEEMYSKTLSQDGNTLTRVTQVRKNNGKVKSESELGDFVNSERKIVTVCEL